MSEATPAPTTPTPSPAAAPAAPAVPARATSMDEALDRINASHRAPETPRDEQGKFTAPAAAPTEPTAAQKRAIKVKRDQIAALQELKKS